MPAFSKFQEKKGDAFLPNDIKNSQYKKRVCVMVTGVFNSKQATETIWILRIATANIKYVCVIEAGVFNSQQATQKIWRIYSKKYDLNPIYLCIHFI